MDLLPEMVEFANHESPNEACGLIVLSGGVQRLVRARNMSARPERTFEIDENAWTELGDDDEVVGIFHSHPHDPPQPSMADLIGCEATGVDWHIVDLIGGYTRTSPSGYVAPYLRRPYVHAVLDCFSLVRDWYNREWKLGLPDFDRTENWWSEGQNLYLDHYESCGFVSIAKEVPMIGDAYLFTIRSKVPNHAAIYVGNGKMLHHVRDRLSCEELYGGMWAKVTTHQLRHSTRISNG